MTISIDDSVVIKIRDTDLMSRHPNLQEDLWSTADDVVIVSTAVCDGSTDNKFTFNSEDVEYTNVTDWDTYVTNIINDPIIIIGETEPWRITAATSTTDGDNYDITITVENPDYVDDEDEYDTDNACTAGDGNEYYLQIGGYSEQIGEAFRIIEDRLINIGWSTDVTPTRSFREAQICKTFELIFFDFFREEGDRWWVLYSQYKKRYESEMKSTAISGAGGTLISGTRRVL